LPSFLTSQQNVAFICNPRQTNRGGSVAPRRQLQIVHHVRPAVVFSVMSDFAATDLNSKATGFNKKINQQLLFSILAKPLI
jgi:hypothetical protein